MAVGSIPSTGKFYAIHQDRLVYELNLTSIPANKRITFTNKGKIPSTNGLHDIHGAGHSPNDDRVYFSLLRTLFYVSDSTFPSTTQVATGIPNVVSSLNEIDGCAPDDSGNVYLIQRNAFGSDVSGLIRRNSDGTVATIGNLRLNLRNLIWFASKLWSSTPGGELREINISNASSTSKGTLPDVNDVVDRDRNYKNIHGAHKFGNALIGVTWNGHVWNIDTADNTKSVYLGKFTKSTGSIRSAVAIPPAAVAPSFDDSTLSYTATQNTQFSQVLPEANDGVGDLTYSIEEALPAGLAFNASTRTLAGTPTALGKSDLTYKVVDSSNNEATIAIALTVVPNVPSFDDSTLSYFPIKDTQFSQVLPESKSGVGTITYSLTGTLPAGLAFNASTRTLAGTPTALGTSNVTYKAVDSSNNEATIAIAINVIDELSFDDSTLSYRVVEDRPFSQQFPEANGGFGTKTYSLHPGRSLVPRGLAFVGSTRTLAGTTDDLGESRILYQVVDEMGNEAEIIITLNVERNIRPRFDRVGYVYRIVATRPVRISLPTAHGNSPTVHSIDGGTSVLPDELTFSDTGLSLIGTVTDDRTREVRFRWVAIDFDGEGAGTNISLRIEQNSTPSFNISNINLTAEKNTNYSYELPAASGGNSPVIYTVEGTLPRGLTFNGSTRTLSGLTTQLGTYNILFVATDFDGERDTVSATLTVVDTAPSFTDSTLSYDLIQDFPFSQVLPEAEGGSGNLVYTLEGTLPTGLSFTASTRTLAGTPTQNGRSRLTYRVVDSDNEQDTIAITLNIAEDSGPTFTDTSIVYNNEVGDNVMITLPRASGGNPLRGVSGQQGGSNLVYSLTGDLPPGLIRNGFEIRGRPTTSAVYKGVWSARDRDGDVGSVNIQFAVAPHVDTTIYPSIPGIANYDRVIAGDNFNMRISPPTRGNPPITFALRAIGKNNIDSTMLGYLRSIDSDLANLIDPAQSEPMVNQDSNSDTPDIRVTRTYAIPEDITLETVNIDDFPHGHIHDIGIEGKISQVGEYIFGLVATDADGDQDINYIYLSVVHRQPIIDSKPVFPQHENVYVYAKGESVALTLPRVQGGNYPINYYLINFDENTDLPDIYREYTGIVNSTTLPPGLGVFANRVTLESPSNRFDVAGRPTTAGVYDYVIVARDSDNDEDYASIKIIVGENDTFPILPESITYEGNVGKPFNVTLPQSETGTAPFTYTVTGNLPTNLSRNGSVISGTPSTEETVKITWQVEDANGYTDECEVTFIIGAAIPDTSPTLPATLRLNPILNETFGYNLPVSETGDFPIRYTLSTLPEGLSFQNPNIISGMPTKLGQVIAIWRAVDTDGDDASCEVTFDVTETPIGSETTAEGDIILRGNQNAPFMATLPPSKSGTSPFTYSLIGDLPRNLTFNASTRVISGTPVVFGSFNLIYRCRDNGGTNFDRNLTIIIAKDDAKPSLPPSITYRGTVNESFSEKLPESSTGDDPLNYDFVGDLPTGLEYTVATRTIEGTPTEEGLFDGGLWSVEDADGDRAETSVSILIEAEENLIPELPATMSYRVTVDEQTTITLPTATGGDPSLTYQIIGNLPPGLSSNATNTQLTGTPTQVSVYSITFQVTDANGDMAQMSIIIDVVAKAASDLAIQSFYTTVAFINVPFSANLPLATGGTGTITYDLHSALPTGITHRGGGVLAGTPTATGLYSLEWFATDQDDNTVSCTVVITIVNLNSVADALGFGGDVTEEELERNLFSGAGLRNYIALIGQEEVPFTRQLPEIQSGTAPFRYELQGDLPPGLAYTAATRTIAGVPTAPGTYTLSWTGRDSKNNVDTDILIITIFSPEGSIAPILPETISVNGELLTEFSYRLPLATGGVAPFRFEVEGSLPPGITRTGNLLQGNPTALGKTDFVWKITDGENVEVETKVTVNILADPATDPYPELPTVVTYNATERVAFRGTLPQAVKGNSPFQYMTRGELPAGITQSGFNLTGSPLLPGRHEFQWIVKDADGDENWSLIVFNVAEGTDFDTRLPNQGGQLSLSFTQYQQITPYTLPEATGNLPIRYELQEVNLPKGINFNPETRTLTGTPLESGLFSSFYTAIDRHGQRSERPLNVVFSIARGTRGPSLPNNLGYTATFNQQFSQVLPESEALLGPVIYSIFGTLPNGLEFDADTRTLSGSITQVGTFMFSYRAVGADMQMEMSTITLTVSLAQGTDVGVTMPPTASYSGTLGMPFKQTLPLATSGNAPISYALTGNAQGLRVVNNVLTGIPVEAGVFTLQWTATDIDGDTDSTTITINIASSVAPTPDINVLNLNVAWLLNFVDLPERYDPGVRRYWSGQGTLNYDGEDWNGAIGIIEIGAVTFETGKSNQKLAATLPLTDPIQVTKLLNDYGPFRIELKWIYSEDNGRTWHDTPVSFPGRVSSLKFVNGVLTVPIDSIKRDVNRGIPRYWSYEEHLKRYPNDHFFKHMRRLEQGLELEWGQGN